MNRKTTAALVGILTVLGLAACGGGGGGGGGGPAAGGGSTTPTLPIVFPRFAVVASFNDDTVSSYTVDSDTGQLRLRDYAIAGDGPVNVAMHPNQAFVYAVNQNANSVSVFGLGHTSGFLTPLASGRGSPFTVGLTPTSVVVHPSGKFAYVTNSASNDITAIATNSSTGALTPVPGSPFTVTPGGNGPQSITIDPSGRFAFVVNRNTNNVSTFIVDATTGALRFVSTVLAGGAPSSITIDAAGRFAYVSNQNSHNISVFSINPTSGVLVAVAGSPFTTGNGPISFSFDSDGRFAYVANFVSDDISVFRIDAATGALVAVAGSPFTVVPDGNGPRSVNIDPSGKFAYVTNQSSDNISAFSVDAATGALSPLSASATVIARNGPTSLAMTQDAAPLSYHLKFAVAAGLSSSLASGFIAAHVVDAATGALTAVSTVSMAPIPVSVVAHPSGQFVYTANGGTNSISTYRLGTNTGALTEVGAAVATGSGPVNSIAVDPSGRFAYVTNKLAGSVMAYSILATGALAPIDDNPLTPAIDNHLAGTSPVAVTVDPSGQFAYVANIDSSVISAFAINANTGALVGVGTAVAGTNPVSVTVDPSGRFVYVANAGTATVSGSISAYRISAVSGRLSQMDADPVAAGIQDFDAGNGSTSVTVDATGRFLYVANERSGSVSAYAIDATTGALSHIDANPLFLGSQDFSAGTSPNSIVADPSGRFAYVASGADILTFGIRTTAPLTLREPGIGALLTIGTPLPTGNIPLSISVTGTVE